MNKSWTSISLANAIRTLARRKESGFVVPLATEVISQLKHIEPSQLVTLPARGLAHDHVSIEGTDLLLRIPKQSQLQLSAHANLRYQTACFERMKPSLHTPVCYATLPPSPTLQMGALLVQRIRGRHVETAADFKLIAKALASIHSLPLAPSCVRAPLFDQKNPMSETLAEVERQAAYLARAELAMDSLSMIETELRWAREDVENLPPSPVTLISFDAHPGNFILDAEHRAILVDLEKARYSGAGLDLAHSSLYTSTTWDADINITLTKEDIDIFYATWSAEVGEVQASRAQAYLIPLRRLMWLWSVTWCAKWQVESRMQAVNTKYRVDKTEDWAVDNNPAELVQHVSERVSHYLNCGVIGNIVRDFHL